MTVREVIEVLESRGWHVVQRETCLHQLRHDTKQGTVTLSGRLDSSLPTAVLRVLLRHAQSVEGT